MNYTAHPTAIIDDGAEIGPGTRIWHWVHISAGARIGERCSFGQSVFVGNKVVIGNNVKVQNNVSIYDEVTLEDDVFCGPSMVFTNVINPRSHVARKHEYRKTLIRKGATIGANATIICGIEMGRYAMVGAGAVVTKSVPDYALVLGNPAKLAGWVCQCGVKLKSPATEVTCEGCASRYRISNGRCEARRE